MDQAAIDALRDVPISEGRNLIDGQTVPAADGALLEVISPIDGAPLTKIAASGAIPLRKGTRPSLSGEPLFPLIAIPPRMA